MPAIPPEPLQSLPVYRLLAEAGLIDVPNSRSHSSNWAFQQGELLILALWWDAPSEILDKNSWTYADNYRHAAEQAKDGRRRNVCSAVDRLVCRSQEEALPISLIFCKGWTASGIATAASARALDPVSWYVDEYKTSGDFVLRRGLPSIDQHETFPVPQRQSNRFDRTSSAYRRDRSIRNIALLRAGGRCSLCGELGFAMPDGRIYLETHHIVPLCDGGLDDSSNVAALCPDHHREAHFGNDRCEIKSKLLEKIMAAN